MSPEDEVLIRASKKMLMRDVTCIECGSKVFAFRDDHGNPVLAEHTDRRTMGPL